LNYSEPGSSTVIYARPVSDKLGWYQAAIILPKAGTWTWSIDAFGAFPQPMPTLTVGAPAPVDKAQRVVEQSAATPVTVPAWVGWLVALLGFGSGGAAFAMWMRTSAPAPFAVSLLAFAVAFVGGAYAALPTREAALNSMGAPVSAQAPSAADEAALDGVQRGHDLFLAKGCVVCHAHTAFSAERKAAGLGEFVVGPTLTNTPRDAAFLHSWLKDPAAVKPGTEMPTLGLGEDEINALVKFLSVKSVP
jgi:cytochrome c2